MQAQEGESSDKLLHDRIQEFKEILQGVRQPSGPKIKLDSTQPLKTVQKSLSASAVQGGVSKRGYSPVNGHDVSDKGQKKEVSYASVYQDMFQALAKQETAYDQKVFRAFIAKDFADRFVSPQTRSESIFRDATTQLLQPSKSEGTEMLPGVRHTAELGMQQVKNIAAIIGQVAKDSPEEAQELFSQLDPTLQTQVMSVQSDSFTSEQKLALMEGVHNNMLGNVISGSRALVSALSLASLGAIFIAGAVLGGPVGGTFAVGLAEMGAVSAHFMASRAARVFASIFENFRLERALSKVDKEIADLQPKDQGNAVNEKTKEAKSSEFTDQQQEQLSQLQAKRATLLAERDAARKQILLKATEFLSGASMLVVVAMIPPPVTAVLVLAALSDFVGSKLEKFSHTFTGPGITSKAARASLRVFSFALQLPKKLFQGVNNLGKLSEAQAIKTDNKVPSVSLQVVGTILQAPNKLVKGITSMFTNSPEDTVSMADDEEVRYSTVYSNVQSDTQQGDKHAKTVKEGVKDNIKEQKVEMTADVSKESVHLATRAASGEIVASFFDVLSSFQDLRAYFITQPKEKKHLAALIDIVHQEVHAVPAPAQSSQVAEISLEGVRNTDENANDHYSQKAAEKTVASIGDKKPPSLVSKQKLSHQNIAIQLQKVKREELFRHHENPLSSAQSDIEYSLQAARNSVLQNSSVDDRTENVRDKKDTRLSFRGP